MEILQQFRRQARAENRGKRGKRRRYSRELRDLAVRYRTERIGVGVARVASELGVSGQTLHHWLHSTAGGFRRVEVIEAPAGRELVVVTPGGWRIEGLELEDLRLLLASVLS